MAGKTQEAAQAPGDDQPPRYRVIVLARNGEVLSTTRLDARNDMEAKILARSRVDGHALELWDGVRFIELFDPIQPG